MAFTIVFIDWSDFMKNTLFLQCFLCCFILFSSIMIYAKTKAEAINVGTFGGEYISNTSLDDLTSTLFSELFDE